MSFTAILSEKASVADPLSSVLDDVLRLDKILSTDSGVLIIDQICLVIPDPRRFPDAPGSEFSINLDIVNLSCLSLIRSIRYLLKWSIFISIRSGFFYLRVRPFFAHGALRANHSSDMAIEAGIAYVFFSSWPFCYACLYLGCVYYRTAG
jgi:hypothetical protein